MCGLLSLILTVKEESSVTIVPITLTCSLKHSRYLVYTIKIIYTLGFGILLEYVGVLGYNFHIYD